MNNQNLDAQHWASNTQLAGVDTHELIHELALRTDSPLSMLGKAGQIFLKKSADYNGQGESLESYFPFGLLSHAQMIHIKSQRISSLAKLSMVGNAPNHESVEDSALDLINYAMFLAYHKNTQPSATENQQVLLVEGQ